MLVNKFTRVSISNLSPTHSIYHSRSFCIPNEFQIDNDFTTRPRQSVAPVFFRNIGSPYLLHENFDETIAIAAAVVKEEKFIAKNTQTEDSNNNNNNEIYDAFDCNSEKFRTLNMLQSSFHTNCDGSEKELSAAAAAMNSTVSPFFS